MKTLLVTALLLVLPGCRTAREVLRDIPVEFCYIHPVYGQVCVQLNGKKHYREDLTPSQRVEVQKWVAEKDAAKP